MLVMNDYKNELIKKAIKHCVYDEPFDYKAYEDIFLHEYLNATSPPKRFKYKLDTPVRRAAILDKYNIPKELLHHTLPSQINWMAKHLLTENNNDCWIQFERTVVYDILRGDSYYNEESTSKMILYAIYTGRRDLINLMLELGVFEKQYQMKSFFETFPKSTKHFSHGTIPPIAYLTFFLIEKMGMENPYRDMGVYDYYGKENQGPGIYKKLIDNWDSDLSSIDDSYWDELCEYHLRRIGIKGTLVGKTLEEREEFLGLDLMPMELICIKIVRKQLGLDFPEIGHELFKTPLATFPPAKMGYNVDLDVKYQMIRRTIKYRRTFTQDEIIAQLKQEHGQKANLIM